MRLWIMFLLYDLKPGYLEYTRENILNILDYNRKELIPDSTTK